ncbi:LuxR C-terminal-related transcriptional regulator [Streptomyces pathocidini]|uniref:LuxR C-terminal-related transcriptional regulator n=1 Tax=Streptomyces pathocidini TaxID=1650571 RepID=UPI003400390D
MRPAVPELVREAAPESVREAAPASLPGPLPELLPDLGLPGEADEFVVQVYARTLGRRGVTPDDIARELNVPPRRAEEALDALRGLRLVKYAAGGRGELVAVSPEAAQMELLVPLERAIHDNRRRLAGVKGQLRSFVDAFNNTQRAEPRRESVVVTRDPGEIELRLMEAVQRCTSEVLVMQPCVAQETPELRYARPLVLEAPQRGMRTRVLYPHTARGDAGTRSHVRELAEAGGQIRTSREIHGRFLVFDREVAFVPADDGDEPEAPGVAVVYEPAVAAFLGGLHDRVWQSAFGFEPGPAGYAGTLDDLKSTILELLASGVKDEVIARRVSMSDRTFRRHIAAIMQELGAGSRFQAGVAAAQAGLIGQLPTGKDGDGSAIGSHSSSSARSTPGSGPGSGSGSGSGSHYESSYGSGSGFGSRGEGGVW